MTDKTRRALLAGIGCSAAAFSLPVTGTVAEPRHLSFYHTHTRLSLAVSYHDGTGYVPSALERISTFLRDFRTRDAHPIDPGLLDMLFRLQSRFVSAERFEVISGYRSPITNEMLRQTTSGVDEGSLHMQGRAIDVRLTGVPTARLREAALELDQGGVGYYPRSDFIHLDTGTSRSW